MVSIGYCRYSNPGSIPGEREFLSELNSDIV